MRNKFIWERLPKSSILKTSVLLLHMNHDSNFLGIWQRVYCVKITHFTAHLFVECEENGDIGAFEKSLK